MVETYTVPGPYSLATGERLPSVTHTRETIGMAPIVCRRTATFPSRVVPYFDFTQWGGGFSRATGNGPGAVCINHKDGIMANIQSGRVYRDSRFADKGE